jgi:hypothetical protein
VNRRGVDRVPMVDMIASRSRSPAHMENEEKTRDASDAH